MHGGNISVFNLYLGVERHGYVTIYGYPYEVYASVFGLNDKGQIVGSYFEPDPIERLATLQLCRSD